MLDPIIAFFVRMFELIGRGIGTFIAWLLWPFIAFRNWLRGTGWFIKIPVFALLLALFIGYSYMFYITQFWSTPSPEQVAKYSVENVEAAAGESVGEGVCAPSAMVSATADLIDSNVNQSTWVSSNPLHKAGLLFIWDWKDTPFFDNHAAFQLGANSAIRRTTFELVDRLGRVRGTSSIDKNLQVAREAINYRETAWTVTSSWPFLQPSTQSRYREAMDQLRAFNNELRRCDATFDTRADNLLEFFRTVTSSIGDTSDILQKRMQEANFVGFDARADDRYWFAYGQLHAYHAILVAARSDFREIIEERNLTAVWTRTETQLLDALDATPIMIANGSDASIIKSHLESIGFDLLRVRSNLVEMRDILDR